MLVITFTFQHTNLFIKFHGDSKYVATTFGIDLFLHKHHVFLFFVC